MSLFALAILCLIAWGTWRFGYGQMFRQPFGRLVLGLALVDAVGLAFWS